PDYGRGARRSMAAAAEQPEGPWPLARMVASSLVAVSTYVFLALPCPADKGPTARPFGAALTGPSTFPLHIRSDVRPRSLDCRSRSRIGAWSHRKGCVSGGKAVRADAIAGSNLFAGLPVLRRMPPGDAWVLIRLLATKASRHGEHVFHDDIRLPADGPGFALPRIDAPFRAGGPADAPGRGGTLPRLVRRSAVVVLQSLADAGHLHPGVRGDLQVALECAGERSVPVRDGVVRRIEHQYVFFGMRQSRHHARRREHQLRQARGVSA